MMIDNDNIIRLAASMLKADNGGPADELLRELGRLDGFDYQLVLFAYTLMSKGRYSVISDNPESIKRYRAFAQHIGATAENTQSDWAPLINTTIIFSLPAAQ